MRRTSLRLPHDGKKGHWRRNKRKQRKTPPPQKKGKQWPNGFSRQLLFAGTLCGGERSARRPQKASKREGGEKEIGGVRSINPDFRNFSQIRSPSREERERRTFVV